MNPSLTDSQDIDWTCLVLLRLNFPLLRYQTIGPDMDLLGDVGGVYGLKIYFMSEYKIRLNQFYVYNKGQRIAKQSL